MPIWRSARRFLPILVLGMFVSTFVAQTFYVSESLMSVQIWWCAWAAFVAGERSRVRSVLGTLFAIGGKTRLGIVEAIEPGAGGSGGPEVTLRLRRPAV